jgi:(1->4)-alpha-D-glucan 1-alpha-D-glucosylmutase
LSQASDIDPWQPEGDAILTAVRAEACSRRPPRATYRLQFHAGFTFRDATKLVPYFADLGISHLYASPIFKANPGSTHGYDIVDYNQLNPELGTRHEFDTLVETLHDHGLRLILDFVPNHMGVAAGQNAWWQDVLENGQTSTFARFFDIDWDPLKPELGNKVLLPVLGDQYGVVLESGELTLRLEEGAFTVWYYHVPLPVAPPTYGLILGEALPAIVKAFAADEILLLEFQSILATFERLHPQDEQDAELVAERQREQTVAKVRLADLLARSPEIASAVDDAVARINGTPGDAPSFDVLDRLLGAQSYRLAFWRVAAEEINYRRFFAINELAAVRQELPEVFAAAHQLLFDLIGNGSVDGVRIDHPDGLWDPAGYFRDLQRGAFLAHYRARWRRGKQDDDPAAWDTLAPQVAAWWDREWDSTQDRRRFLPIYLVVEKILSRGEQLPAGWPIDGTVGYEFAMETAGLFVDIDNASQFDKLYSAFTGNTARFADLAYEKKKLIMRVALASEVQVLSSALDRITEHQRRTRDFTLNNLRFALREVIACFPIYRTYVTEQTENVSSHDRQAIEQAVRDARRRNPSSDWSVFNFIRDLLLTNDPPGQSEVARLDRRGFAIKFQQLTGPVMAKGVEDTVFYIYNRLTSLNEVGGEPALFGIRPAEVHEANARRLEQWPDAMLTSSTHDTKRSEDIRARIHTLSEMPREWRAGANRWSRLNRKHRGRVDGVGAPDKNDEYLLYQTLLGVWPYAVDGVDEEFRERVVAYMDKATREAQVNTSWTTPNEAYDLALQRFVRALLDPKRSGRFLKDFAGLWDTVCRAGAFTALSQQILKLTSPGVPDVYQGTEVWDFSLVDPDNRRPVDFAARARMLRDLRRRKPSARLANDLVGCIGDGRIKLFATERTLALRRERAELFARGSYEPLTAEGPKREHVFAFRRRTGEAEMVVVVPRLIATLLRGDEGAPLDEAVWGESRLMLGGDGHLRVTNIFTGQTVTADDGATYRLADVFAHFPVAVLVRDQATSR